MSTGEVRPPRKGEWYITQPPAEKMARCCCSAIDDSPDDEPRVIMRPVESEQPAQFITLCTVPPIKLPWPPPELLILPGSRSQALKRLLEPAKPRLGILQRLKNAICRARIGPRINFEASGDHRDAEDSPEAPRGEK